MAELGGKRQWKAHDFSVETALTGFRAEFSAFYGGIDGAVVTERNREITPLMSNLTEAMASELACQIVLEDFNRPQGQRHLFAEVSRTTVPGTLAETASLTAGYGAERRADMQNHVAELTTAMVGGPVVVRLQDMTQSRPRNAGDERTIAQLVVQEIEVRQNSRVIKRISGAQLPAQRGFTGDKFTDSQGREDFRGRIHDRYWAMHGRAWVEFELDLPPGEYTLVFKLGTWLGENMAEMRCRSRCRFARPKILQTRPRQRRSKKQINALLMRATHREASRSEMDQLVAAVLSECSRRRAERTVFDGITHACDTWSIWGDDRDLTDEARSARYSDPAGMLRGWTTLIHGVLTSYGYLHD